MCTDAEKDLWNALQTLRAGGVILYPTDTVWGIGCDATCHEAVERIFRLKQRPDSKAMLLLVTDREMLVRHVREIPEAAERLLANATRPTTVIYGGAKGIAPMLIAADGSVGIRIPDDSFCRALCRRLGHPLVSTSANLSGQPAARCFGDIDAAILRGTDYVCTRRHDDPCETPPSAIYKISDNNEISTIRE